MVVILPDELKKKSEEMRRYKLPSGEWKSDTPDFIKKYKAINKEVYSVGSLK